VAEWFKALDSKSSVPSKGTVGSTPTLSAFFEPLRFNYLRRTEGSFGLKCVQLTSLGELSVTRELPSRCSLTGADNAVLASEAWRHMYGKHLKFEGRISGFTMGTGSTLALLPAQNATGNFVKVVQRLPVRIDLVNYDPDTVTTAWENSSRDRWKPVANTMMVARPTAAHVVKIGRILVRAGRIKPSAPASSAMPIFGLIGPRKSSLKG
jgi:hypothetical protein